MAIHYLDKSASLIPSARAVIEDKKTEYPHSGAYNTPAAQGSYLCRRCGLALFRANSQFSSSCGWPSFDAQIAKTIKKRDDADGVRWEIVCSRCEAHLGHVFSGEQLTEKNKRYCVNSAALDFVVDEGVCDSEEAIIAGGCFWGIDYYFRKLPGILKVETGYTGGKSLAPSYDQICHGDTGHFEAVRVLYNPFKIDYYAIIKRFFEIHDPTQITGQGPDIGAQYQSAVFYHNEKQRKLAQELMECLCDLGFLPATRLIAATPFWPAENHHQNYYNKHNKTPYCHRLVARFEGKSS